MRETGFVEQGGVLRNSLILEDSNNVVFRNSLRCRSHFVSLYCCWLKLIDLSSFEMLLSIV